MTSGTANKERAETKASTTLIACLGGLALLGFLAVIHGIFITGHELVEARMGDPGGLSVATWNVAAINNNPFEYWITHDDPEYNRLMGDVQTFIDAPGDQDVRVDAVFTEDMWLELKAAMTRVGWGGVDDVEAIWRGDYSSRKIISGFVQDGTLGKKRLASMPDRVTNTIRAFDPSGNAVVVNRPTVINCYDGAPLDDGAKWWKAWRHFFFETKVALAKGAEARAIYDLLNPIKRSKYPALTEAEERVSLPLQTLAGAIFDAILVHMANTLHPHGWQALRADMCDKLNRRKDARTVEILDGAYRSDDVIFLQETATAFRASASATALGSDYHILSPASADPSRDQNSLVLLKRARFPDASRVSDVSDAVASTVTDAPTAPGDLAVFTAVDAFDRAFTFASFHGDTNGLATIPVTDALLAYVSASGLRDHVLVFGLDANTYKVERDGYQGVLPYQAHIVAAGLASHRGNTDAIDPEGYTTFNARTYLQPQLNKAVAFADRYTNVNVDHNPKDFLLFYADQATLVETGKDNTGNKRYIEDMMFPTLAFPSDHGITAAKLKLAD